MIRSYYTATNGALSSQNYLDMMSNNMANIQTVGYKKSKAEFSDLLYTNIKGTDTKVGSGSKVQSANIVFNQAAPYETGGQTDFAIKGDGFFAVQFEENTYLTRGGNFQVMNVDDENYLMYQGGYVLDENEEPILVVDKEQEINVGVFVLENNSDLQRAGNNLFEVTNEDVEYSLSENPKVMRGFLESSGVEITDEMIKLIQIQKSFQLNSKIIQTADEIEQTINSLKN